LAAGELTRAARSLASRQYALFPSELITRESQILQMFFPAPAAYAKDRYTVVRRVFSRKPSRRLKTFFTVDNRSSSGFFSYLPFPKEGHSCRKRSSRCFFIFFLGPFCLRAPYQPAPSHLRKGLFFAARPRLDFPPSTANSDSTSPQDIDLLVCVTYSSWSFAESRSSVQVF